MLMSDFLGGMGNAVKITADVEVMAADGNKVNDWILTKIDWIRHVASPPLEDPN